jgi:methionine-rich copper-binding protein CopC
LRKLAMVAAAATATLALATAAIADPNDDQATLTVKASPTNSGTKKKPTNVKLNFSSKVNLPGTTVEVIDVLLPNGVKFATKGFKKCNVDDLLATGTSACPSGSKAGPKGTANALVGPANAPLNFDVYPFVENSSTIAFYLSQQGGGVQSVVHGKITNKGRNLSITIPLELRQPGGLDATLTGLNQTFSGKAKKNYIVSSTKCPKGGWEFGSKLTFATRVDGTPPPAPEAREVKVSCKK